MSKEYNGGKAGYWINTSVALIPALLQLVGGLFAIYRAGKKSQAIKNDTGTTDTVPTQDFTG